MAQKARTIVKEAGTNNRYPPLLLLKMIIIFKLANSSLHTASYGILHNTSTWMLQPDQCAYAARISSIYSERTDMRVR